MEGKSTDRLGLGTVITEQGFTSVYRLKNGKY